MHRFTRNAAAALAAVVAFSVSAPAATAAPKTDHVKGSTAHGKAAKSTKSTKASAKSAKAAKSDKGSRQLTAAQRKVTKEAARKDAYLARLLVSKGLARLDDAVETALRANIDADRTALASVVTAAATATGDDLQALARQLRGVRPEGYNTVVNQARQVARLQAAVAANAAELAAAPDADATLVETNAAAVVLLDALVAELVTFDASTTRAELRAAQRDLSAAWKMVGAVEDALEVEETEPETEPETVPETEPETVPETEEPVEEAPVEEGPVTEEPADPAV